MVVGYNRARFCESNDLIENDSENDSDSENHDDHETFEMLHSFQRAIDMETNNITMARKKKRIHCDFSSEASIDNPQIKAVAVITSNSRVDAVITSGSTQGSANGMPFYKSQKVKKKRSKTHEKNFDKLQEQLGGKILICHSLMLEHSDKNAINRSHLTYNHKAGSKSFSAHEYDEIEEMIGMKNDTTLPDGTVTLTDDEIVLEVLGHKSGYFKGPSKFLSSEDFVLSKHLEERLDETKEKLGEEKQEIQELKENQKKFEELLHKIMEGQQPPP
ncbi:unnamed protein product [Malus baccata var. baccata]